MTNTSQTCQSSPGYPNVAVKVTGRRVTRVEQRPDTPVGRWIFCQIFDAFVPSGMFWGALRSPEALVFLEAVRDNVYGEVALAALAVISSGDG